jgi:hypothetical protein
VIASLPNTQKLIEASPTKNKGDLINYDIKYRMGCDSESEE